MQPPALLVPLGAVLIPAPAFLLGFPQRTDYVGHYLAGAGGTALLLAVVLLWRGRRPWWVVTATVVAVLLGVGTEATVFRIAIFDPVDLANQSLGAVVVASGVVNADGSWRVAFGLLVFGVCLTVAGFQYAFA